MSVEHDPWCPSCGDEFQPYMTVCPDCAVTLEPGPRPEQPPAPERPHGLVERDLRHWEPSARRSLALLLDGESIGHEWHAGVLRVAADRVAHVDGLIEWLDDRGDVIEHMTRTTPPVSGLPSNDELPYASPARRLAGVLLDGFLVASVLFVLGWLAFGSSTPVGGLSAALRLGPLVVEFVCIGVWGRTLGKLLVGTRVVRSTGEVATWGNAALRVFLPFLVNGVVSLLVPVAAGLGAGAGAAILGLWFLSWVLYLPILWDRRRQGLHDRVADTVVVRTR